MLRPIISVLKDLPPSDIDSRKQRKPRRDGWISACHPLSPAWIDSIPHSPDKAPRVTDILALKHKSRHAHSRSSPPAKTFIHDHRASMDPCLHPSHLLLHGQFIQHGAGPIPERKLIPQFSYSPTLLHDDITVAVPYNWVEDVYPREDDPPFQKKDDSRLHWRGRNTGVWQGRGDQAVEWSDAIRLGKAPPTDKKKEGPNLWWWLSHRGRLVDWANKLVEEGSKTRTLRSTPNELWAVGKQSKDILKANWAPGMVDIAFAGDPINCDGAMCDKLKEVYEFRRFHDGKDQGRYKYVMDVSVQFLFALWPELELIPSCQVDGNGWSSRFKRRITSHSVIFKSTIYPEWYTDRVAPWVHYVPIQNDFSDLLDTLYFFRGDPSGKNAHEHLAEKIARQGREWSLKYWRMADMTAYTFRLFLEYARVMSEDRDVTEEVDLDASLAVDWNGKPATPDRNTGTVKMRVGKQDYLYKGEDEYAKAEREGAGGKKREWDWKYRQRRAMKGGR